ncbi:hypothetical protein PYW07_008582 [Mythimna separata]|uniref:Uncharacterized protein n=1 Tax=Mythimna separata TaxID=271217 RepID=A0AAD7YD08_MYTSE|nr:hypothetical protein PYW07_008582 [Mythimna separata]
MKPDDIEAILRQLENGEISEDELSDNEDDIDYYSSQRDLQMELEDEDDVVLKFTQELRTLNVYLANQISE